MEAVVRRRAAALAAALAALAGCRTAVETPAEAMGRAVVPEYEELAVLTEALLLARRHYVRDVPFDELVYG